MGEFTGLPGVRPVAAADLHKQMVLDSLAAGKHVYIEKPMTWSIEEGQEIIPAVNKSGLELAGVDKSRAAVIRLARLEISLHAIILRKSAARFRCLQSGRTLTSLRCRQAGPPPPPCV